MTAVSDALAKIASALDKYPGYRAFITQPGIAEILIQAAENGWTPDVLAAHIQDTPYWKNTTDAQRHWDLLKATDPATAQQTWSNGWNHLMQLRRKLGVQLTDPEFQVIATQAINGGWTDDISTTAMLGVNNGGPLPAGGDLGAAITQIKGLASDYGVNVSDLNIMDKARKLLTGGLDPQGLADGMRGIAISQYGNNTSLVDALNRGDTVKQYADPYIQLAVNELGVNPATVDFSKPKWNAFLTAVDPKTGEGMNLQQWTAKIRTDPTYGYNKTSGAADQAAQLTDALAKEFGAVG